MIAYSMTGTRNVPAGGDAYIRGALLNLPEPGVSFASGAQRGADTVFALEAATLFPDREHVLYVPDAPHQDDLPVRLSRVLAQERDQRGIPGPPLLTVHRLERKDGEKTGTHYLRRNGLVLDDGTGCLLAFPESAQEVRRGSGTWACVRDARRRRMQVRIFPLDGDVPWVELPSGPGGALRRRRSL